MTLTELRAAPDPDPTIRSAEAPERCRMVTVRGRSLHARCWVDQAAESATPVVLLHGLGVASRMCRPAAQRLSRRHDVYAPDLPGFGRSDPPPQEVLGPEEHADALAEWMEVTGLEPAVVVGISIGAQVAAEFARRYPEHCRAVVLASPTVDRRRRTWRSQLLRWPIEQSMQTVRFRLIMLADYAHCGVGRVVRTFSAAMRHRVEDAVGAIERPVLVCWGSRDPLLTRDWAEELAGRAFDGEFRAIPGGEHALSHESPLELARVTEHFIEQLDEPEPRRGAT
jgi:2-hydroxy-6-oxonona-2,4-dienedioate hydrolase